MAIDQGTTGTRVILFGHSGDVRSSAYKEIKQVFINPGWVEHDAYQYLDTFMISLYLIGYNDRDVFCSAEPLGPGADPYQAMNRISDAKVLDDLVKKTADYF